MGQGHTEDQHDCRFTMVDTPVQAYELDGGGTCTSCEEVATDMDIVKCRLCKKRFHVVCSKATKDDLWAVKSMIVTFKAASTRRNFMFLCNGCLTVMETNLADVDGQRIRQMESNMVSITKELSEIKKLVSDITNITRYYPC